MELQKIICPQCGSNELELFGVAAYKCESCGTILKEDKSGDTVQQKPKEKPFRSGRIQHGLDDQPDFSVDQSDDYRDAGNSFMKQIFWIGIIGGIAALVYWLLSL